MPTTTERPLPQLVSVVIPVYNAMDLIDIQLDALADQVYSGPFEVIIADNGSTDGLRDHIEQHPHSERLQLRWIDAAARRGPGAARNIGSAAARGEFIAFCDADDRVYPDWLSALIAAAPRYAAVGGPMETRSINSPAIHSWRRTLAPEKPFKIGPFVTPPTCNAGVWTDVFMDAGGFDESFDTAGEDCDLMIRIQLSGGTVGHAPGAVIAYRLRDTPRGSFEQSARYGESMVRLYATYRDVGVPKNPWYSTIDVFLFLILRNPLLPEAITRVSLGRWLHIAGWLAGWIKGSFHYRCSYL